MNSFVGAFHDAVILYAHALNETLEAGFNATNGTEITRRMWNRTIEGNSTFMKSDRQELWYFKIHRLYLNKCTIWLIRIQLLC